jgi:hypothetical protein
MKIRIIKNCFYILQQYESEYKEAYKFQNHQEMNGYVGSIIINEEFDTIDIKRSDYIYGNIVLEVKIIKNFQELWINKEYFEVID